MNLIKIGLSTSCALLVGIVSVSNRASASSAEFCIHHPESCPADGDEATDFEGSISHAERAGVSHSASSTPELTTASRPPVAPDRKNFDELRRRWSGTLEKGLSCNDFKWVSTNEIVSGQGGYAYGFGLKDEASLSAIANCLSDQTGHSGVDWKGFDQELIKKCRANGRFSYCLYSNMDDWADKNVASSAAATVPSLSERSPRPAAISH